MIRVRLTIASGALAIAAVLGLTQFVSGTPLSMCLVPVEPSGAPDGGGSTAHDDGACEAVEDRGRLRTPARADSVVRRGSVPPRASPADGSGSGVRTASELRAFAARGHDACPAGTGTSRLGACDPEGCAYHVAPNGSDRAPGTAAEPWATITHAAAAVPDADCTVIVADGVYRETVDIERRFQTSLTVAAANRHGALIESDAAVIDIDGASNIIVDGFEMRHLPGGTGMVVTVSGSGTTFTDGFTLRNSIVHDSYDDDLIKLNAGVRNVVISDTITYNPGPGEHHFDLNGVEDVTLRHNIMFNDYARSGREVPIGKMFVIVKDSNVSGLDLGGSKRIALDGNVFIGWSIGGGREAMVKTGNDGKAHYEAVGVVIENNLFLSNGPDEARSIFGAAGVRDVVFRNNTINHAAAQYQGYRLELKGDNPANENIVVCNNVWSGVMADFARVTGQTNGLAEHDNIYWNRGQPVPDYDPSKGTVVDPGLEQLPVPLPESGDTPSLRRSLIEAHGTPNDAVVDAADPACASDHDILGRDRGEDPDIGALEISASDGEP